MSKELVKTGHRMYELAAKLEAEQQAERAPRPGPSPSRSFLQPDFFPAASPRAASVSRTVPAVFLEWGACAIYDREFYTRIERQASGLYLRVACVKADEGMDYAGQADSRVLKLDQITGPCWPCPWCGIKGDVYQCDCGFWVCGGRVDARRNRFYCRKSCGRSWDIGDVATKTQVSEETRRGQWKAPRDGGRWQAPASSAVNGSALLLRPVRRK